MADNFTDNPWPASAAFRAAYFGEPGADPALAQRGLTTRDLDQLAEDVLDGTLPQVSWIVATAEGSEHPGPSSPAQGADYTARVLEALTANPDVWAKTVLFVNFDENDGFFDHVPPPAAPSYVVLGARTPSRRVLAGASTVDTRGEYHEFVPWDVPAAERRPAAPALRPGPARADVRGLAVEQGRLGQLAGVRPHLGDPLPRAALRRAASRTSRPGAAPSAAT